MAVHGGGLRREYLASEEFYRTLNKRIKRFPMSSGASE